MPDVNLQFKPHRGGKSKMTTGAGASTVLADGELFVEYPDTGVGSGHCRIKMGDGVTAYSSLPYALGDVSTDEVVFSADSSTTITTALNKVVSGAQLGIIVAALKQAVALANTAIIDLGSEVNPTEVEWEVWQTMTDQQKEGTHWLILNAPGGDGDDVSNIFRVERTLAAGATTLSVTNNGFKTSTLIFIPFTSNGAMPTGTVYDDVTHTITFTFEAQETDITVVVLAMNGTAVGNTKDNDYTNTFPVATTAWVSNSGSDATDFPYVANIATTDYSDAFTPAEVLLLGADITDYMSAAEKEAIALVDPEIKFTGTSIRLRATDAPASALTLVIRG